MTKEQFCAKWEFSSYWKADLEAVISHEIAKAQEEKTNKIEITPHTLVEVNRTFRALKQDKNSYIHKVFSDDGVFDAMEEIRKMFDNYFVEQPNEQIPSTPTEQPAQPSSQAKLDNSFDKERFERIFCAIVASGKTETWEQDFKGTIKTIEKLDAYYASKNN